MKKYEYVNISAKGLYNQGFVEHKEIINKYAAMGYRYVGYIPTSMTSGPIREIDLIFEKDIEDTDK